MGLLARVKEKLRAEIREGRDLVNTARRTANNAADSFVSRQIKPVQSFAQREISQIKPFVQRQIQRPMVQKNIQVAKNFGNPEGFAKITPIVGPTRLAYGTITHPKRTLNQAKDMAVSTARDIPRYAVSTGLTLKKQNEFNPQGKFQKVIFGKEKVLPLVEGQVKGAQDYGFSEKTAKKIAPYTAAIGLIGAIPFVGGGVDDITKSVAKAESKKAVKKALGKSAANYADDVLETLVKTKDRKVVGEILKNAKVTDSSLVSSGGKGIVEVSSPTGHSLAPNRAEAEIPAGKIKEPQIVVQPEQTPQYRSNPSSFGTSIAQNEPKLLESSSQPLGLPEGQIAVRNKRELLKLQKQGRDGYIQLKPNEKPISMAETSDLLNSEQVREEVATGLQKKYDDFERLNFGSATSELRGGSKGANLYQRSTRSLQEKTSGLVESGLKSGDKWKIAISRGIRGLFGGSGDTAEVVTRRGQFKGGVQDAENLANNFMEMGKEFLPDQLSKEKVWAFLDPELSGIKVIETDLSPQELEAVDILRQASDLINDTNFSMGKISHETWLRGRNGKYFTRAYDDYDLPPELSEAFGGGKGKLDIGQYKARGEIDDWKRENAIKDPFYLASKRIQSTFQNKAISDYGSWIAKQSGMVSDLEKPGFTKLSDSKMWGDLSGKYVRKDILEGIKGFYFDNKVLQGAYDAINWYDKNPVRQTLKKTKTVFNPATRLGNQISNRVFAAFNGINPIFMERNMQGFARAEIKNNGKYARFLRQNGVLGNDMTKYELVRQLASDGADAGLLKRADEYLKNSYGAADDEAKLAAFKYWLDKGKTLEEALVKVRNGFQDYSKVGMFYDIAAKMPIVGKPFIRFQSELGRIIKNSVMENPLSLATVVGSIAAVGYAGSKLSGESVEDKQTRESRFGVPVIPFTQIPLVFQTPYGEVNVARMFGMYETVGADTKNKNIAQRASKYLPFDIPTKKEDLLKTIGNDVMLGGITSLITDTDFRGKSISDPDQTKYKPSTLTPTEKLLNRAGYVYHNYQIPFINDIENVIRASANKPNIYGKTQTTKQALSRLGGFKIEQFGHQQAEDQRAKDIEFSQYDREDRQKMENSIVKDLMSGKINQATADKRLKNLGGSAANVDSKVFKGSDGWKYLNSENVLKTFDTEQEAKLAVDKDTFDKSGKKSAWINDTYYFRKSDGTLATPLSRKEYDDKVRDLKLTYAQKNDDYKTWLKLANEKKIQIEEDFKSADELTQTTLQNEYDTLMTKIRKYQGYGGFKKGKKYSLSKVKSIKIDEPTKTYKTTIRVAKPKKVKFKAAKIKTYKLKVSQPKKVKLIQG